ncbi:MAG: PAS domain S-box-containing protein [Planctomycetaceae bacterium]|jgi:PAS domain S-box-containing protein
MNSRSPLRDQAEQRVDLAHVDVLGMSDEEVHRIVHDLQVHQIELEIQNEELRNSQAELAAAHDRYADLYEFAPVGYATLDRHGSILAANLTLATMLGVQRRSLLEKRLSKFVNAHSQDTLYQHLNAVYPEEEESEESEDSGIRRRTCDLELKTASGGHLFARLQSDRVIDDTDEVAQCRTAISDITAQKIAEIQTQRFNEELERRIAQRTDQLAATNLERVATRERLKTILDSAADAIVTIDRLGIIQEANHGAEKLFGCSPDEFPGQDIRMLMPKLYFEEQYEYIRQYLASDDRNLLGWVTNITGLRKDGSTFPTEFAVSEINGQNLFTGVFRDLTLQQSLQRKVLSIAAGEQKRIGADLHDGLCQNLAGIALIADALALSELSEAAREQAQFISDGLKHAARFARDVAQGLVPVGMDSGGLMMALTELSVEYQTLPGISCSFVCPSPVQIQNNETATHLYHIAREACVNAVRHGSPGRLRIMLEQSGELGVLAILDDGCGIDESKTGGSEDGRGIQIMKYRAGLFDGRLTIQRRSENGGTTVACSIPLKKASPTSD